MLSAALLCASLLPAAVPAPAPAAPGEARVLLSESFDSPAALARWRRFRGLRSGEGPDSVMEVADGALHLAGDERTGRWLVLERTLDLGPVRWLRLAARMRSEGVTVGARLHVNSGLWYRFDEGEVTSLPELLGSEPWTPVARRFVVPRNARRITVGAYLTLPGELWIDDLVLETAPDWQELKEGPFLFSWLPGDQPTPEQRREVLAAWERAKAFLELEPPYQVVYRKYPSPEVKQEYTGSSRAANLEGTVVHTTLEIDRHEMVHLIAQQWGRPAPLLSEGLATWLAGDLDGRPWQERARALAAGGWVPLGALLERQTFIETPEEVAHPIAAALVDWILAEASKEDLKHLYAVCVESNLSSRNAIEIEHRLGHRMDQLDALVRERAAR